MLDKILKTKQQEVETLTLPTDRQMNPRSLKKALTNSSSSIHVISEVKKASPSKGLIREDFDPVEIAKQYEAGGADAISVLTDEQYFQGHRDYLMAVKDAVDIPVMRKDFIIDEKQVEESARIGADAILLIAAAMEPSRLYELYTLAYGRGLECLVEVHNQEELDRLLDVFNPEIIGVNNRDLKTFTTTLRVTENLSTTLPKQSVLVSESGIYTREDIERVERAGAQAVLVGESLMRLSEPGKGIATLKGGART